MQNVFVFFGKGRWSLKDWLMLNPFFKAIKKWFSRPVLGNNRVFKLGKIIEKNRMYCILGLYRFVLDT